LVKGAYLEPPEIALSRRREVDAAFARCLVRLIDLGHSVHVATHDPRLIEGTKRFVERRGVSWSRLEFPRSAAFAGCLVRLIDLGHSVHVATHDPRLIEGTKRFVERRGVSWSRLEFQ